MTGEKLKEIRKLTKMDQGDFAAKIYANRWQVSDWERGISEVPLWAQKNIEREFFSPEGIQKPPENPELETLMGKIRILLIEEKARSTIEWIVETYMLAHPEPPAQSSLITDDAVIEEVTQRVRRKYGPKQIRQLPGNPPANKGRADAAGKGEVRRRAPRTHKKG